MDHIARVADSFTIGRVAEITHRDERTIRRWIASGQLTSYVIQREHRIPRADLEAFLASGLRAA